MPVSFSRLRIAGFKSFAEPAVVDIRPGLTGIVGPNGCGKSNVVEALRWAMGESSPKSLRGDEMDDVIFAGTAARPSRNLAEVTLLLDEAAGIAPPPFHEHAELEISRRIERGRGSFYRVNGREARARDVQTLFADLATGAHSSGMVSQGRVSAIVNARPDDRRRILEEAAGITGLHARRHEAELKLRAAEANLGRAEDLRQQLESQLEALKRQARQAARYRNISGAVRAAEAELLAIQRARVLALREAAQAALHLAAAAVAGATGAATAATTRATEAAAALPPVRSAEAEARTSLERQRLAGEQIAAERQRAQAALAAATTRLEQIGRDLGHAEQLRDDAVAATGRLAEEDARLTEEFDRHPALLAAAEAEAAQAADGVRGAEAEANRATEHAAELAARHRALAEALAESERRAARLTGQRDRLAAEQAALQGQRVAPDHLAQATAERDAAAGALAAAVRALDEATQARAAAVREAAQRRAAAQEAAQRLRAEALSRGEQQRSAARAAAAAAREAATQAAALQTRLAAEVRALSEVLKVKDTELWPRMVDQLVVPAGLEAALGAALGEELDSAADTSAARHWREQPPLAPMPALPDGVPALSGLVEGPAALGRALSQIGLVEDGSAAQARLLPGQMLVSRSGALWRWDGYTVRAGTETAAAVRLMQRNRLAALRTELGEAEQSAAAAAAQRQAAEAAEAAARGASEQQERAARAEADAAEATARAEAQQSERRADEAEQQARAARSQAERLAEQSRGRATTLAAQAEAAVSRLAGLDEQVGRIAQEYAEAQAGLAAARAALSALADPAAARAAMEARRQALAAARARDTAATTARDALTRAAAARLARAERIAAERADWTQRAADAVSRVTDLAARRQAALAECTSLQAAPAEIAGRHALALEALEAGEAAHRAAADRLVQAEAEAAGADRAARAAEGALAGCRESVARIEGELGQADAACSTVAERIAERLGAGAALPNPPAEISEETEEKARRKLDRLQREREEMGPVNLRAEVEAEEIGKQIETILRERDELTTAIAKLRGSIGSLNREGRERLAQVFEQVDNHFQTLFSRMFGGGRAHLALVGSDDPLVAGLEIYAQPPGKKLSTLSLLSGGEQALTALSLIFAVFRCNPAPVCVLDEVDAPLDDANVERFCTLLADMVRETATRFLVVTHHPLTMARMDRLYGVTMQERGVSRLLSVDLQRAEELVDGGRIAAE